MLSSEFTSSRLLSKEVVDQRESLKVFKNHSSDKDRKGMKAIRETIIEKGTEIDSIFNDSEPKPKSILKKRSHKKQTTLNNAMLDLSSDSD